MDQQTLTKITDALRLIDETLEELKLRVARLENRLEYVRNDTDKCLRDLNLEQGDNLDTFNLNDYL